MWQGGLHSDGPRVLKTQAVISVPQPAGPPCTRGCYPVEGGRTEAARVALGCISVERRFREGPAGFQGMCGTEQARCKHAAKTPAIDGHTPLVAATPELRQSSAQPGLRHGQWVAAE